MMHCPKQVFYIFYIYIYITHLHVELAEDFGTREDAKGDLVDTVVLHVQRVDGGELRRAAHRVRLETVACQRQTRQVHQAREQALGTSREM